MQGWQALSGGVSVSPAASIAVAVGLLLVVLVLAVVWRARARRRATDTLESEPLRSSSVGSAGTLASLRSGLAKTRSGMLQRLLPLLGRERLDPGAVEELEAALLAADVGVRMTERLIRCLREERGGTGLSLRDRLEAEVLAILEAPARGRSGPDGDSVVTPGPRVVMVVGVNGVGKTTSIGKLAARYTRAGKRTLLVAADTFRAAAIEQLTIWAERSGADLVRHQHGGDPGAVAYDGVRAAVARGVDVVIVDTAGRLHTKSNLMEELRKVRRVIAREIPGAPHETLLVIDAVTGQNGLAQARAFVEHLEITGIILTKLDGTARGGIVLAIAGELDLPIRFVGVGEGIDDLREFDPGEFASALLASSEPIGLP
jgi:fused signal recognition particle receptor